ncbi:uncharacterized protein LOC131298417 [Rhododendron vialii]|uniref:uncharacterized protein LOC131298417 n=1 Tax=Rhododendron vialii TaxID=182163 RepID=UPI00265ED3FD|nr:uncharacterized protein LOC131298417 [Rhododendron vialii]
MGSWLELLLGNLWVDDLIGFGTTPPFPHCRFRKEYVVFLFAEVRFMWSRHNTSTAAMNSVFHLILFSYFLVMDLMVVFLFLSLQLPNNWRSHRVRSYTYTPSDFHCR